jgi:hypothetical protein
VSVPGLPEIVGQEVPLPLDRQGLRVGVGYIARGSEALLMLLELFGNGLGNIPRAITSGDCLRKTFYDVLG